MSKNRSCAAASGTAVQSLRWPFRRGRRRPSCTASALSGARDPRRSHPRRSLVRGKTRWTRPSAARTRPRPLLLPAILRLGPICRARTRTAGAVSGIVSRAPVPSRTERTRTLVGQRLFAVPTETTLEQIENKLKRSRRGRWVGGQGMGQLNDEESTVTLRHPGPDPGSIPQRVDTGWRQMWEGPPSPRPFDGLEWIPAQGRDDESSGTPRLGEPARGRIRSGSRMVRVSFAPHATPSAAPSPPSTA